MSASMHLTDEPLRRIDAPDDDEIEKARTLMRHLHEKTVIAQSLGYPSISLEIDDADELIHLLLNAVTTADALRGS